MARHQELAREENRALLEKIQGNNETLNEMREENRAPIEKVEESDRQLSALREQFARCA